MEKIPIIPFIMQSLPEGFIALAFGLVMIGIKPDYRKILLIAILTTMTSYLVRSLPIIFGIHTLIQLVVTVGLVIAILKLPVLKAVFATLVGSLSLGLLEVITSLVVIAVSDISLQDILANYWLRVIIPLPHLILLGSLIIIITRKNWVLLSVDKIKFTLTNTNRPLFYLLVISLLQAFLLVMFSLTFFADYSGYFQTTTRQNLYVITTVVLVLSALITITVAYYMLQVGRKEARLESEQRQLQGMQNIYLTIRQQQHDFINHLTSLYGLLRAGENIPAYDYIASIYKDVKKSQVLLNIKLPGLGGLLESKRLLAERKNIDFTINIEPDFSEIPIKPVDLTGIVGNLIDNALDAAISCDNHNPSVWVDFHHKSEIFTIAVENTGLMLDSSTINKIFKAGFTSKNKSHHSGLGLYTVNNLVEKNNGNIVVEQAANLPGIRFEVNFAARSDFK